MLAKGCVWLRWQQRYRIKSLMFGGTASFCCCCQNIDLISDQPNRCNTTNYFNYSFWLDTERNYSPSHFGSTERLWCRNTNMKWGRCCCIQLPAVHLDHSVRLLFTQSSFKTQYWKAFGPFPLFWTSPSSSLTIHLMSRGSRSWFAFILKRDMIYKSVIWLIVLVQMTLRVCAEAP